MALLDSIKDAQRVTNSMVNGDYTELIDACKRDLIRLGIDPDIVEAEGVQVTQACKLWVHWYTDYQGKGDAWRQAYNGYVDGMRKDSSNLAGDADV
ncbi:MAG: hypothetical protein IJJ75_07885 [Firmicutes bacterium]|nr:hypothetical protein [Bacillota bacterium]